jgi:2-iminobutanoate/2-iminopropanoate deaminase
MVAATDRRIVPTLRTILAFATAGALLVAGCEAAGTPDPSDPAARPGAEGATPGAAMTSSPRREVISPAGATRIASYSSAIRTGDLVFFSGVIGTQPGTRELAAGGIQPEMRQAWQNLAEIMEAAGVRPQDLVKCTVFLADIAEFDAMNEVYSTFFTADPPARSTVGVAGLPIGARVELECIAAAA